jgi:hypothetical protein
MNKSSLHGFDTDRMDVPNATATPGGADVADGALLGGPAQMFINLRLDRLASDCSFSTSKDPFADYLRHPQISAIASPTRYISRITVMLCTETAAVLSGSFHDEATLERATLRHRKGTARCGC